jgi:D-alanyl-D-alanine carboxypeptidase
MDWQSLYEKYVFDPLDLNSTKLPDASTTALPSPHPKGFATALDPITGAPQCGTSVDDTELSPSMGWTAGGVVSTLSDMKTWAQALATGSLISDTSKKAQWKTTPIPGDNSAWQGYGLGAMQLGPMRGHDGDVPGFISAMLSDPKSGLTVVVVLNDSTAGSVLARSLALELTAIAAKAPAAKGEKAPSLTLPWSPEQSAAAVKAASPCQQPPATPAS